MNIACHNCQNQCCTCSGCQPQFVNGNWYCPRCAVGAGGQAMARTIPGTYQAVSINNNNWQQYTSNHLRKR